MMADLLDSSMVVRMVSLNVESILEKVILVIGSRIN